MSTSNGKEPATLSLASSGTSEQHQFADIDPEKELVFKPVGTESAIAQLHVINVSGRRIGFKIQSDQNTQLQTIAPSCGFLQPDESIEAMIFWKVQAPNRLRDGLKGQFQILITPVETANIDRRQMWRDLPANAPVQSVILHSRFDFVSDQDEQMEIDVAKLLIAAIAVLAFLMMCVMTCKLPL